MINAQLAQDLGKAHQQELMREAEQRRLARQARRGKASPLASIGEALAEAGEGYTNGLRTWRKAPDAR